MKTKRSLIHICLLGAVLLQTLICGAQTNLVQNGGFETGDFTGWSENDFNYGSAQVYDLHFNNPHSGSYDARFRENAYTSGGVYYRSGDSLSQSLPTQVGASYLFSFWLSSGSETSGGICSVLWNGNFIGNNYFYSTPLVGWTNIQLVVSATGANTVLEFDFQPYPIAPGAIGQITTFLDDVSVTLLSPPPAGYNQISASMLTGGNMQLSFVGNPGANYALDQTFNLSPPANWVPQATNSTDTNGFLIFTNAINTATNNFWRIRSVP